MTGDESLAEWASHGWLRAQAPDAAVVAQLLGIVRRELLDSEASGLSVDSAFTHLYQAGLTLGTLALHVAGYRVCVAARASMSGPSSRWHTHSVRTLTGSAGFCGWPGNVATFSNTKSRGPSPGRTLRRCGKASSGSRTRRLRSSRQTRTRQGARPPKGGLCFSGSPRRTIVYVDAFNDPASCFEGKPVSGQLGESLVPPPAHSPGQPGRPG